MNRRLLKIKSPFEATRVRDGLVRPFQIGETIWFDIEQLNQTKSSVKFQVDNEIWGVGRDVLVTSTSPPNS
jgi:hypothetical protein